ncbi:galactosyltransferase-related protein [Peribacillus frigoritolerans]|uniref:galactosyltransferase-related protein n=1 Tax=Peribacillus frigoritolerans TaxID=450367 RepID=UPI00209F5CC8|nr:galactosyltransferase-related protein [Peribacillus frigoritolerans]MCP1490237.1 putative glycosyltransferase involved in capsule biosynthesis [Peribacillus frigoritolerans]
MLENLSILIPYQSDNGVRDINFKWIKEFYNTVIPEAEICIGFSTGKLFNRSQAINLSAKQATRDIFVIADGDIFYDPAIITDSIKHLKKETWIIPFRKIKRISKNNTKKLMKTDPTWPLKCEVTDFETIHTSKSNYLGGLNIITRDKFMTVNGFDERFVGWGGEDDAFSCAVNTICGNYKRLDHTLYHLWHPKVGYKRNPNAANNLKLRELYYQARRNKEKMKKIISDSQSIF